MTYTAPLADMRFALREMAGLQQVAALPGYEHATDDTVDALPVPPFNSDDTVTIDAPRTWMQRVAGQVESAISGAFSRLGRSSTLAPSNRTGIRKR